jgi:hypothetical protein
LPLPDTLYDLSNSMNNFWFCYAIVNDIPEGKKERNKYLNVRETFTFWSLKGITLSKIGSFQTAVKLISVNVGSADPKLDIFKKQPGITFPGYL